MLLLQREINFVCNEAYVWSYILHTLFWTEPVKNNNLFLNMEVDSEFSILSYNLTQSLKVEEKKEYLKQ